MTTVKSQQSSDPMHCTVACQGSQHERCKCSCHGKYHGTQTGLQFAVPGERQCNHCPRAVHFEQGRGWVHPGGSPYIMECPECGWQGEQPDYPNQLTIKTDVCPACGVIGRLRDNHIAMPGPIGG